MDATNAIFYIAILVMSVVIHEVSHGFMAEYFGDQTARYAGRLTLNPLPHLDMLGSIIVPGLLVLTGSPVLFGWAKPVPYNPNNLRDRKWGTIWVAAAGVLSNFLIATVFGIVLRLTQGLGLPSDFYFIMSVIVVVNIALGVFNLIPIPPLDGSKILFSILPPSMYEVAIFIERYSLVLLLAFILFLADHILYPVLSFLFWLITGLSF
jgi:Zn-dependent protease